MTMNIKLTFFEFSGIIDSVVSAGFELTFDMIKLQIIILEVEDHSWFVFAMIVPFSSENSKITKQKQ